MSMSKLVALSRPQLAQPPLFNWSEVDPRRVPPERYAVERMLPARGAHLVLGPPKGGKSQFLAHTVASIIARKDVLGRYPVDPEFLDDARVLWIMAEETRYKPRQRVEANLRGFGWSEEEILALQLDKRLVVSARDPGRGVQDAVFSFESHGGWLRRVASEFDLIILDSLRPAHGRDENSSQGMKLITDTMRELSCLTCFVATHHTGHETFESRRRGADRARGTSDLDAARDTAIVFEQGSFGRPLALGIYHRDDAELHMGVVTRADREAQTAVWAAEFEGTEKEVSTRLKRFDFLAKIQAARSVDKLPSLTDAKKAFGDSYKDMVRWMAKQGLIVSAKHKTPGPGAPRVVLMLPGQFAGVELLPPDEL